MTRTLITLIALSSAVVAAATTYDRSSETTTTGIVVQVLSAEGAGGVIGVHLNVKTDAGIVQVHVGPAPFIGQNNFWFQTDDEIQVVGANVLQNGVSAVWARLIKKNGATLKLRDDDGTPLWKVSSGADPDGCGLSHAIVR